MPETIDPSLQPLIEAATADLVVRLGIDASEVTALIAQPVTWPDSSLGCPQPGMQYLQVLVDGAQIELQAGGKTYSYRSGESGTPFLCEKKFVAESVPPNEP